MKHLIKSTAILTLSNVLTRILSFIFFIVLAKLLSVSEYGEFRYLLTLAGIYAITFSGIPTALATFLGKDRKEEARLAGTSLLLTIGIFLVLLIPLLFTNSPLFLALFVFAVLVDSFYLGFIQGILNYAKLAGYRLVENIIQLVILVISFIIYQQINFTAAVVFFSFSGLISVIIFEIWKPQLKPNFKFNFDISKKIIIYAIPVALGSIGWIVMTGINTILIKHFYSNTEVAYYSVGITLVQIFTFLPAAVATIAIPKVAGTKNKNVLMRPLVSAIIGTITLSIVLLIPLIIFKEFIVTTLFKSDYSATIPLIFPLAIGQIAIGLHQIYASIFQGLEKPLVPTLTITIAGIMNALISLYLIPTLDVWGAAVSYAITSIIAALMIATYFHTQWKTLSKA